MGEAQAYDVIVIGAGPAGLAAALALREAGVASLVVLEREGEPGGATRHCGHPPFGVREFGRLLTGPAYARRLAREAAAHGIAVRYRHSVVALRPGGQVLVATPEGSRTLQGRRVVLALGARETSRAARLLTGDRPLGVLNTGALQAHIHLHGLKPFARPVIVGTELVGLSAIWTCLSHGIRPQMVVEPGPETIACWPLGLFPRLAGIPLRIGATVTDIRGNPRVEGVEVTDREGRRNSVPCDGLLLTGRFLPESGLLRGSAIAVDPGSGGPVVDQFGRCSDPAYLAAGNLLRPIENACWCFAEGRAAGRTVAQELAGRLAPAAAQVVVRTGPGVSLAVPQRISVPGGTADIGMDHVQVRLAATRHGTLRVRCNGVTTWSRALRGRVERRTLLPVGALAGAKPGDDVEIDFA